MLTISSECRHEWIVIDINYELLRARLTCVKCDENSSIQISSEIVITTIFGNLENESLKNSLSNFRFLKITDSSMDITKLSEGEWKKILFESNQDGEILYMLLNRHNWDYTIVERTKHFDMFRYILLCKDGEDCPKLALSINLTDTATFMLKMG